MTDSSKLLSLGVVIILAGFFVVFVGALMGAGTGGSTSTGGFILIGPIPIVFGSGPEAGMLATVALVISVVMIAVYLLSFLFWGARKRRGAEAGAESE